MAEGAGVRAARSDDGPCRGAVDLIRALAPSLPDGLSCSAAGTVDRHRPRARGGDGDAGACFVVSPVFRPDGDRRLPTRRDVPAMPGCFSPTEILAAPRERWPTSSRVFPATMLGPQFLKDVRARPLPQVKLMPTGGRGRWITRANGFRGRARSPWASARRCSTARAIDSGPLRRHRRQRAERWSANVARRARLKARRTRGRIISRPRAAVETRLPVRLIVRRGAERAGNLESLAVLAGSAGDRPACRRRNFSVLPSKLIGRGQPGRRCCRDAAASRTDGPSSTSHVSSFGSPGAGSHR